MTPTRFAGSVALGVFVGTLPFYGTHFLLCALLVLPLRLNLFVAYAAAHISIPPLIPFLLMGSYWLGVRVMPGSASVPLQLELHSLARAGETVLVGSVLLGLLLATCFGLLALSSATLLARAREGEEQAHLRRRRSELKRQVVLAFAAAPRKHRYYVALKLATDPLADQLLSIGSRLPQGGTLFDGGCGRGQFSLLLAVAGDLGRVVGLDLDGDKVDVARHASRALLAAHGETPSEVRVEPAPEFSFEVGDLAAQAPPPCDVVALLDVLHYLSGEERKRTLTHAALALRPGGCLLVRETGHGWRAGLAMRFERWGRALGMNRGRTLDFATPRGIVAGARQRGLVLVDQVQEGALDNVLFVFEKEGPSNASIRAAASDEVEDVLV